VFLPPLLCIAWDPNPFSPSCCVPCRFDAPIPMLSVLRSLPRLTLPLALIQTACSALYHLSRLRSLPRLSLGNLVSVCRRRAPSTSSLFVSALGHNSFPRRVCTSPFFLLFIPSWRCGIGARAAPGGVAIFDPSGVDVGYSPCPGLQPSGMRSTPLGGVALIILLGLHLGYFTPLIHYL